VPLPGLPIAVRTANCDQSRSSRIRRTMNSPPRPVRPESRKCHASPHQLRHGLRAPLPQTSHPAWKRASHRQHQSHPISPTVIDLGLTITATQPSHPLARHAQQMIISKPNASVKQPDGRIPVAPPQLPTWPQSPPRLRHHREHPPRPDVTQSLAPPKPFRRPSAAFCLHIPPSPGVTRRTRRPVARQQDDTPSTSGSQPGPIDQIVTTARHVAHPDGRAFTVHP
jgi:hypothetical protein